MNTYEIILEPYCEGCPEFESDITSFKAEQDGHIAINRVISCEHYGRCRKMEQHLRAILWEEIKERNNGETG